MTPELISCDQSLKALSSFSAAELESSQALRAHAASCPDCARVAAVVLERERSLGVALASLRPAADPAVLAGRAALAAERRGTARFVKWILIAAMAATVWFALDDVIGGHERELRASMRTETIQFSCLTPAQAETLIEPYIRANGHGIYFTPAVRSVTVRGLPSEVERARALIVESDFRIRMTAPQSCALASIPPAKP